MKEKLYCIYSKSQEELTGSVIWRTPDGKKVCCTSVTNDVSLCHWEDKKIIGEVTEPIERGANAKMNIEQYERRKPPL